MSTVTMENPRREPGASVQVAETRNNHNATPPPSISPATPLKISDTAAECIDRWADDLAWGRLSIPDLPASLRALYLLGTIHGEQSQRERIDRLTYERDTWYFCANNRGVKPGDYLRHQTSQLWNLAVTS
jgi:hypothetical protein